MESFCDHHRSDQNYIDRHDKYERQDNSLFKSHGLPICLLSAPTQKIQDNNCMSLTIK